ncbi:MAG: hypothetical protein NVS9B10_01950 [Nevskia sp.]
MNAQGGCDTTVLNVKIPADYRAAHPYDQVKLSIGGWNSTVEDYDIYVSTSTTCFGPYAGKAETSGNPEVVTFTLGSADASYRVCVIPYTAGAGSITANVSLVAGVAPPPAPVPVAPSGLPPRFKLDVSPQELGNGGGEPSIGYNFLTRNGMFVSNLSTLRITYPWNQADTVSPPAKLPESCDATWVDVSSVSTSKRTLDPILYTNSKKGRTYVSQQTTGPELFFAYTDSDGASWTEASAAPPSGSEDHQTVGTGPYVAGSPFAQIAQQRGIDYATYYCGQTTVTAFCARSDNGGASFNNGVPIFSTLADCGAAAGALHGHVKVGPDGAVYVPPKSCGSKQAVIVSEDSGLSWAVRKLPNSTADTEIDPSVAIGAGNTLYDCYIAGNGHPHVQISKDHGRTWSKDYDIGAAQGIEVSSFPEAVAGDDDRASCAFIGTTTRGNHDALDFPGIWYGFVATTYDGGTSWHTVNVTPNDPVQGVGGVCNAGTITCGANRNLLDFNEITMDEFGRVMFGFADGCIGACVQNPAQNSYAAKATVARQTGGRSLLKRYDDVADGRANSSSTLAPAAACLAGTRSSDKASLDWKAPDTGGAAIAGYRIFRGTSAGSVTQFVADAGQKTRYDDYTVDSAVGKYFYKVTAVNAAGEGIASNLVSLQTSAAAAETSCATPGITVARDPSGDSTGGLSFTDILSLGIAEPLSLPGKLAFTIKTGSLSPAVPPNTYYFVLYGGSKYIAYDTQGGSNRFTYGTYAGVAAGVLSFTELGNIDTANSKVTLDGTITLVALKTLFGTGAVGSVITPIEVRVRQGAASNTSADTTGTGDYTMRGTDICLPNNPPIATLAADKQSGVAPLTVSFTASATDQDAVDTIVSFKLDYGDGGPVETHAASNPVFTHTYAAAGAQHAYPARLTAADSRGGVSANLAERVIDVSDGSTTGGSVPDLVTVSLAAAPTSGSTPLQVQFDATASASNGTPISSYTFYFGDGSAPMTTTSSSLSFTYTAAGNFDAQVVATDAKGYNAASSTIRIVATASVTVTPSDRAVAALTVTPTSGSAPLTVHFDGSRSFGANGKAITSYAYDFGDGSQKVVSSSPKVDHVYTAVGTYAPTLTVTDASGNTAKAAVNVKAIDPATGTTTGGTPPVASSGRGGAFGLLTLLPLMLVAVRRRRRRD